MPEKMPWVAKYNLVPQPVADCVNQPVTMMKTLRNLVSLMWPKIRINANLVAENIALRQQLAVTRFQYFVRSGDSLPQSAQSRDLKSDRSVDSPAGRGGLALGHCAKVFDAGSGFDLWRFLS